ncbi:MAG: helix-hairpin-helix domain-containing protein [Proteobacteria bacterium]|nr:helix-hairpin-helix domain-containing protein [Pseudomonadota bacterium]
MHFDLSETGAEQQNDERLILVFLFISLLLLSSLSHYLNFTINKYTCNNMMLNITNEKLLYLQEGKEITQQIESLPLQYYPFFFLPLPINSADKELLMTIKGIGPILAESIVTHRDKVGPIHDIGDFQRIPGIGGKKANSLATKLVFDKAK